MVILNLLTCGLYETLLMVFISLGIGIIGGCTLGTVLFYVGSQGLKPKPYLYQTLGFSVNSLRSIPYIILIVLLIPLTRLLVGSSIGTWAAIIPLSIASILLIARATEDTFKSVPKGLIEMGLSMGASSTSILGKIIFPEVLSVLISHITNITITLIGFSAMAGTVGGGGLGDLAIRYGYQRYDTALMLLIVFILLCLVQLVQTVGERLSRFYQYH
jgi:D-methionine transport system permease protein